MEKVAITIVGAGVVGLAVAAELSGKYSDVVLIEKEEGFGRGASSRNSEVIHASIYYPRNSLKGALCLRGNELIYKICLENSIPNRNSGKLIIANTKQECENLPELLKTALSNGAKGVRIVERQEIRDIEPRVEALKAIYCPTSGVVDSHELMRHFEATAVINGATVLYNSELSGIKHTGDGYILTIGDNLGNVYEVLSKIVINAAGLYSGKVAEMAGIDADKAGYRINYHKGVYFRASRQLDKYPEVLIYPVPPESGSVGIHTTPDLYGGMRLGPHFFWADSIDYSVDDSLHKFFYESVKKYLPFIEFDDIAPDSSGIMSTIRRDGEPIKDFVIQNESGRGLNGLINLIGIDSPGLTASPAIAEYVGTMVKELSLV